MEGHDEGDRSFEMKERDLGLEESSVGSGGDLTDEELGGPMKREGES